MCILWSIWFHYKVHNNRWKWELIKIKQVICSSPINLVSVIMCPFWKQYGSKRETILKQEMKPELAPTDMSFWNKFHNKTFKLTNGICSFNIHRQIFFLILHVCTNTVDVNQTVEISRADSQLHCRGFIIYLRIAAWTVIGQINIIVTMGIGFNTWNQIICSQ